MCRALLCICACHHTATIKSCTVLCCVVRFGALYTLLVCCILHLIVVTIPYCYDCTDVQVRGGGVSRVGNEHSDDIDVLQWYEG